MKRIVSICLCIFLVFSLMGCTLDIPEEKDEENMPTVDERNDNTINPTGSDEDTLTETLLTPTQEIQEPTPTPADTPELTSTPTPKPTNTPTPTEKASFLTSTKITKSEFNETTNYEYSTAGYVFSIPNYFQVTISETDTYRGYAEAVEGQRIAVLQIVSFQDTDEVSFSALDKEEKNGSMKASMTSIFNSGDAIKSDFYENSTIKGYLYSGTFLNSGLKGEGKCLMFPAEKTNSWIMISILETEDTEYTYMRDFEKILGSISVSQEITPMPTPTPTPTNAPTPTSTPTPTPKPTNTPTPKPTNTPMPSSKVLTVDNCPDLKKLMTSAHSGEAVKTFWNKYGRCTIEVECLIFSADGHDHYVTMALTAVDKNFQAVGPYFVCIDVEAFSIKKHNIKGSTLEPYVLYRMRADIVEIEPSSGQMRIENMEFWPAD